MAASLTSTMSASSSSFMSSQSYSNGVKKSVSKGAGPLLPRLSMKRKMNISCEATPNTLEASTPETLKRVVEIVANQLATSTDSVNPQSKFQDLGADSLDQVEIVMALEEEFNISVSENGAESISTVQDAADLIERAVSEKSKNKE